MNKKILLTLLFAGSVFVYADRDSGVEEKDIVYYRVVLTEKDGKIDYTCTYNFWYKIRLSSQEAWVYGYFIQFENKIPLQWAAQED